MKTKKILSVLAAVAMSVSAFSGLALTASAAQTLPTTYAGGHAQYQDKTVTVDGATAINMGFEDTTVKGARMNDNSAATYAISDSDSADLKALFDADSDNYIDSQYTQAKINYIGTKSGVTVDVDIDVDLASGSYTMYYLGGNTNAVTATLTDDTAIVETKTAQNLSTLKVTPITIFLSQAYNGKITMTNTTGWLPDLYSIKLVQNSLPTENDVIKAADITRTGTRAGRDPYDIGAITANDSYTGDVADVFGADFAKAGTGAFDYTDTEDYAYVDVKTAGTYKMYVLGENTQRDTAISFTKLGEDIAVASCVAANAAVVGTDNAAKNIFAFTSEAVTLDAGMYKVSVAPSGTEAYYTNLVAFGMKAYDAPAVTKVDKAFTFTSTLDQVSDKNLKIDLTQNEVTKTATVAISYYLDGAVVSGEATAMFGVILQNVPNDAAVSAAIVD